MKRLLIPLIASSVIAATAQAPGSSEFSPKGVLERFVKMDVEGERLTPQGWHRADALFVKSSKPFQPKVVLVIARSYAISRAPEKTSTTEFYMGYEEVGHINTSSLQFTSSNSGVPTRSFDKYTVVLTDGDRMQGTARASEQEGKTAREWKIDGAQPTTMHLTANAAIRFVTQMRDGTADPAVRKNADQTLLKLAPFR
jgi:hypothetical protein